MDRSVVVKLKATVSDFQRGFMQAGASVKQLRAEMTYSQLQTRKHVEDLSKFGLIAGGAVAVGLGLAVGASMRFEKAMSNVGALTHASAGELMGLRSAAMQAGKDTAYTASAAADAEAELAKAGIATADIIGGGLRGALNLAAAGQIDVASAAEIAASAMVQFNLTGRDVPHVADLLASAADKAQGGVGELGDALKYVGPVAHQMGVSIEETIGTLGELASQGILADMAGRSLRGMLTALTSPSALAAKTMAQLGINVYDAAGNFVGFSGIAGQLHDHLSKLTAAQRDLALGQIFGNEQITAARILYAGGAKAVEDWTAKVNDAGFATQQANAKLDNLAGDLKKLQGSLEVALIQAGSGANAALRGMAHAATGAVNAFASLPNPVQESIVGLAGLTGAGLGVLGVIGTLYPKILRAREALQALGTTGMFVERQLGRIGKGLAIGAGVFAGLELLVAVMNKIGDAMAGAAPSVERVKQAMIDFSAVDLGKNLKGAGDGLSNLGHEIEIAQGDFRGFSDFITHLPFTPETADVKKAKQDVQALDQALADLVTSGHAEQAHDAFTQLSAAAGQQGVTMAEVEKVFPQYQDALTAIANSSTLAAGGTKALGDAAAGVPAPVKEVSLATDELGRSTRTYTGNARDAAGALVQYKDAADALKASIDVLNGTNIAAGETAIAFQGSLLSLTTAFHDNGKAIATTKDMTVKQRQAVLDNNSAILSAVKAAEDNAAAVANQTGSVQRGNDAFAANIRQLRGVLRNAGLTDAQINTLITTYARVPASVNTNVRANTGQALSALAQVRAYLDSIQSKTIAVTTIYGVGYRAGPGQPVAHQHGILDSPASHWAWVGEAGPELMHVPRGASIYSAPQARAIAAGAGRGTVRLDAASAELLAAAVARQLAGSPVRVTGRLVGDGDDLVALIGDRLAGQVLAAAGAGSRR